ncbi:MAG: citramalate synthase [Endomicrobiia bacterium]|nr:citramalate synthase [Endomicrobiia bacterium]
MMKIKLYDTTLRDGSQSAAVSFTVDDKLKIARRLSAFGMDYIEGGWPGSNPTDEEFFRRASRIKEIRQRLVAFGSTRYKRNKASDDPNLRALVKSGAPAAAIFGKTWDMHVTRALRTTLDENLKMIADSVAFVLSKGINVIYDAEHFFDGYKANRAYALSTIKRAASAGAFNITLCDTNGGALPDEISRIVADVVEHIKNMPRSSFANGKRPSVGIHTHNDAACGAANALVAVESGATLVQGTINGIGERCGNANLCSIIPALSIKLGFNIGASSAKLKGLTELSRYVDEVINRIPDETQPYVGRNAFAHKGGIHVSAVERHPSTYEHVDPALVGNTRRIVVSELSGKSNVLVKAKELKFNLAQDDSAARSLIENVKKNEAAGYQYEDADGSFALLVLKTMGKYSPFFNLKSYRTIVESDRNGRLVTEATVKLEVGGNLKYTVAEGDGPVNALDKAMHESLEDFYPELKEVSLRDFKVRVINPTSGTAAAVRVLIESADERSSWGTVGVSENLIEASWLALCDALEYKLFKDRQKKI